VLASVACAASFAADEPANAITIRRRIDAAEGHKGVRLSWTAGAEFPNTCRIDVEMVNVCDTAIPDVCRLGTIQTLTIYGECPTEACTAIKHLESVGSLKIYRASSMSDVGVRALCSLPVKKSLVLENCVPDDEFVLDVLAPHKREHLSIRSERLTEAAVEQLIADSSIRHLRLNWDWRIRRFSAVLAAATSIERLELFQCALGPDIDHHGGLEVLGRSKSLRTLVLDNCHLSSTDYQALGRNRQLEDLTIEDRGESLPIDAVLAIASMPNLKRLCLNGVSLEGLDMAPIAERCHALRQLELNGVVLNAKQFSDLAGARPIQSLRATGSWCDDAALKGMIRCEELEYLDISFTAVSDGLAPFLSRCRKLRTARLGYTKVGPEVLRELSKCESLKVLSVEHTNASDAAVAMMCQCENLEEIDVASCSLDGSCIESLASLPRLRHLDVGENSSIADGSIATLQKAGCLESLRLTGTAATNTSLMLMSQMGSLRKLSGVGCRWDEDVVRTLASTRPELQVIVGSTSWD
jgi:hypothetical protein